MEPRRARGSAPSALPQTPHLVFAAEPRRVSGSGGCNRFAGEYERDGERLRLGPLASTRKACIHGMDTEVSFHAALERVRSFRIAGRRLELLDDTGRILAVFEATAGEYARDPA